jgi:cell division protein FtsI (penicillin-binding protein 3)
VSRVKAHRRLALFMGMSILFLVLLLGRTFYVQVVAAPKLQVQAENQQVRTLTLDAPRGTIYDRNGEALAISRDMATIYVDPRTVVNAGEAAEKLAPVLGIAKADLLKKMVDKTTTFRYLARRVEPAIGDQVKKLELAGIGVLTEPKRMYPKGALAPQLLGFVGGTDYAGMEGLELEYDSVLSGTPGKTEVLSSLHGNRLSTISTTPAKPGKTITLTIDSQIQFEAEKALSEAVDQLKAKRGCAIVMDPRTGELLAMASTPVFDPSAYGSQDATTGGTRNWMITDMYEPGSTFKMITVAAALEDGIVTPDTEFTLPPTLTAFDYVIHEAENVSGMRTLTVTKILVESSNIGAVTLGKEVGKDRLVDMIQKFGFTKKLGVDFPGETAGQLPQRWNGVTIYQVPMGQGVAVSPLQLATAYSAIANGGVLVQPHLAKDASQLWSRQVVSSTVAAQLRGMLHLTVEEGTGKNARLEGYTVAGKTGTAQKPNEKKKGYSNEVIASFVGMVPADSPRLVVLVMIDEPQTERLGAKVAAPVFARITDFALKRLGIPPSGTPAGSAGQTSTTDTTATGQQSSTDSQASTDTTTDTSDAAGITDSSNDEGGESTSSTAGAEGSSWSD